MLTNQPRWTEQDSITYRQLAAVAVPARAEQLATLLTLLPFAQDEPFHALELCCGEGILSSALLDCFPQARLVALDGSAEMRQHAARRLRPFGSRAMVEAFDLTSREWTLRSPGIDCVLSSLCVHHLDAVQKQSLFQIVFRLLSPRSVFLLADLVEPQRSEARALFAESWDRTAAAQAAAMNSPHLFDRFEHDQWNHYRFPDPMDRPSPLFDQLRWLHAAGFDVVDCFWLRAGHAIYGGYKGGDIQDQPLPYHVALDAINRALSPR